MISPKPNQEYRENVVLSIQADEELQFYKLVELMFEIIDHFCNLQPELVKPGRKKTYPDRLILKLDMLMHLTGKRGETEIFREAKRHCIVMGGGLCLATGSIQSAASSSFHPNSSRFHPSSVCRQNAQF